MRNRGYHAAVIAQCINLWQPQFGATWPNFDITGRSEKSKLRGTACQECEISRDIGSFPETTTNSPISLTSLTCLDDTTAVNLEYECGDFGEPLKMGANRCFKTENYSPSSVVTIRQLCGCLKLRPIPPNIHFIVGFIVACSYVMRMESSSTSCK